jgi:transposase-like protein
MTYPSSEAPTVPPAREGHRRRFSEADKQQILKEASRPDANLSQISRRYGIARRVLCRWKQETAITGFVTVQVINTAATFATAAAGEVAQ